MSDDDQSESGTTLLTAEYKNGQLQIIDMPPAKRSKLEAVTGHLIKGSGKKDSQDLKFVQVLDSDKNVVVDLLNLTLVKCNNGQESYRLVSNDETESGGEETVTCVLSNDDGDEQDSDSYVVMEGDEGPMVFLQSALAQSPSEEPEEPSEPAPTPVEMLEKAKSLQKAKSVMSLHTPGAPRGRRRKSQLPPPHELLASPHFKLYLYSCKMCDFKCNAIKELTAHKAAEHAGGGGGGGGGGKWRGGPRAAAITLQCARCPYRGNTHPQLMKHVKDKHSEITTVTTTVGTAALLESAEVSSADVLVCGACGFECAARDQFKRHIVEEHGVVAC